MAQAAATLEGSKPTCTGLRHQACLARALEPFVGQVLTVHSSFVSVGQKLMMLLTALGRSLTKHAPELVRNQLSLPIPCTSDRTDLIRLLFSHLYVKHMQAEQLWPASSKAETAKKKQTKKVIAVLTCQVGGVLDKTAQSRRLFLSCLPGAAVCGWAGWRPWHTGAAASL